MPDLLWNTTVFDGQYAWAAQGDEWSQSWGGSEAQWFGCLWPRLHRLLPAARVLELAPGYGRWTQYLLPQTLVAYWGIDLSATAIAHCQQRFASVSHATFAVNDGMSLPMVPRGLIDVVFSFDSLVHAEQDVLDAYVPEILACLTPDGIAVVHHSNWGAQHTATPGPHARAASVSAATMAQAVTAHGGRVLLHEVHDWGDAPLNDCLTVFCHAASLWRSSIVYLDNRRFMAEAAAIRHGQQPWSQLRRVPPASPPGPAVLAPPPSDRAPVSTHPCPSG